MMAAINGAVHAIALLIEQGADMDRQSAAGWTALMYAVEKGELASAKALIASGANVNLPLRQGQSSLVQACFRQHREVALE